MNMQNYNVLDIYVARPRLNISGAPSPKESSKNELYTLPNLLNLPIHIQGSCFFFLLSRGISGMEGALHWRTSIQIEHPKMAIPTAGRREGEGDGVRARSIDGVGEVEGSASSSTQSTASTSSSDPRSRWRRLRDAEAG